MHEGDRVCIIDDDGAIREALQLLLYADGISSEAYSSADQFLAREDDGNYACMLLDIRMPGMDGFELFRKLIREGFLSHHLHHRTWRHPAGGWGDQRAPLISNKTISAR
jgi:FixJ family two-component response regulator